MGILAGTPTLTDQISLGVVILGALLTIATLARVLFVVPTKSENGNLRRRLGDCETELADKARRLSELGAEKDALQKTGASEKARADALAQQIERLPQYEDVIKLQSEAMEHVDRTAAARQEAFLSTVIRKLETHDEHVQSIHEKAEAKAKERHDAELRALERIAERLPTD